MKSHREVKDAFYLSSAAFKCHTCLGTDVVQVFLGSFRKLLSQDLTDKSIIKCIVSNTEGK